MSTNYNRKLYKDYEAALLGKEKAEKQVVFLNQQCQKLKEYAESMMQEQNRLLAISEELAKKNAELEQRVAHLAALLGIDSTNSSLPTSKTPINKEKHIPNSREKSGKSKGGQPGLAKAKQENHIVVDNIRHYFPVCRYAECGKLSRVHIPKNLKKENQYGPHVQTPVLSLSNVLSVPVNKVQKMVEGLTAKSSPARDIL